MLSLNVVPGDALFCRKGRHGVGTGQIHGNQFPTAGIGLFDHGFFFIHGNTGPVAHMLIAAGEGIVHGGLTGIGITCKRDSHNIPPS